MPPLRVSPEPGFVPCRLCLTVAGRRHARYLKHAAGRVAREDITIQIAAHPAQLCQAGLDAGADLRDGKCICSHRGAQHITMIH